MPTLNVAGWWDQEDFYGPVTIYEALEHHDTDHQNFLVVGPWNHGGWAAPRRTEARQRSTFGSPTSLYFRQQVLAPLFAYYLKDKGTLDLPEALTFEAGRQHWVVMTLAAAHRASRPRSSTFSPQGTPRSTRRRSAGGDSGFDAYVSDPANPVPVPPRARSRRTYQPGGSGWTTWLVEDQRFADGRPDVLTYETEPLTEDVVIAGDIIAHLFASTSGTDSRLGREADRRLSGRLSHGPVDGRLSS